MVKAIRKKMHHRRFPSKRKTGTLVPSQKDIIPVRQMLAVLGDNQDAKEKTPASAGADEKSQRLTQMEMLSNTTSGI